MITGVMAAGKSTVAELLAERCGRAVHVRGDVFRRFVVSGRAEPEHPLSEEAWRQLRLRYRLAAMTADAYVDAGFLAILQDVILGPVLTEVLEMITARPVRLVVLDPTPAAVEQRERHRDKTGYGHAWTADGLVEALRSTTPHVGLWLDTSTQQPQQTVDQILACLDEALVEP